VYNFPRIAGTAVDALVKECWGPALEGYAGYCGLSEQDLVPAAQALAKFQIAVTVGSDPSFLAAWFNAGFDRVKPAAQVALFYNLGLAVVREYHQQVREAMERNRVPQGTEDALQLAERAIFDLTGSAHTPLLPPANGS
jgi:hypothetical protein